MANVYPVLETLPELKEKLLQHAIVILQAPPGAGKSTILPLHMLDEPWLSGKKIVMLEPRRLAARSVASRMASLMEEEAGQTVGYRIRFETKVSSVTRIEVVTEGILTRMLQQDNSLEDVGLVIFDEFHERSLQADLALALCLQTQQVLRDDLRILIMSATLDGEKLSSVLGDAPIITSSGKQYPVEYRYVPVDQDAHISIRMARTIRKAVNENDGDILAFFPGAGEIGRTQQLLEEASIGAAIHVLYGDLPLKKQQEAILPDASGRRKIVLATSLAETSLTIEGISVVIDSGLARVPRFDPRSGLTRLETIRVTKDAADQRAGRAGRLGPGVCYRLWSEGMQHQLVLHRSPEILDADLAPLMLELSQWGVTDVNALTWITIPPSGTVNQAVDLLHQLDALENSRITERGKAMLKLPTHPRIAHMLLEASTSTNLALATDIAALLEERDPLPRDSGADFTTRISLLRKWRSGERVAVERNVLERIERLASSWRKLFKITEENTMIADHVAGKLLAAAYPERIARQVEKNSERYKLTNGRVAKLPMHDALTREKWLAIAQLDAGGGEGKIFLAAPLDERDLLELAHEKISVQWDSTRGLVVGAMEKRVGNLVLTTKPLSVIPVEERIKVLCQAIRDEGLKILGWEEQHDAWCARVMSLRQWHPKGEWPDVSETNLLDTLEEWLKPYLNQVSKRTELERLELQQILTGILPWNKIAELDTRAPAAIEVPSGSMIRIQYFEDGRIPVMEVRLQEVFGLFETPVVNGGTQKIILHLLSPGFKPVQVTQDLRSFWQNTYHEVRKELRLRYPKHAWPDDPWTAKAVRGAIRRRTS
ncbi:MAG: ATP-dependent helicase HrpB [Cyclobacteriaceae bacterium]|nr:ATP-dependent helicase HrpB [Cyclobacteriaceae bacterium]